MAGFASPMPLYQTSPPFSPYHRLRGSRRRRLITAYHPLFKVITMAAGPHSLWIFRRKCPRLPAGRLCQWPGLHQTSQTMQMLCGKQLLHEPFSQLGSLLLRPPRCEISALSMYLFYFSFTFSLPRKMAVPLFTDRQHIRMSSGAFSACG